jgi:S-adenosylmethionine decarboxylase proenzyme
MFNNYISSGKHMICDFKGINNYDLLNNCTELNKMLKKICTNYNFQILGEQEYVFTPIGCSILFLLSESHISIHTFPEKNHMSFDIYTCRQYNNNHEYLDIYNFLINYLQASDINSTYTIIDRYF